MTSPTDRPISTAATPTTAAVKPVDRPRIGPPLSDEPEPTNWLREIRNFASLLLLVLIFHSFIAKPFYIPSSSMMPILVKGDRLWVSKYPYGWSSSSVSFHLLPPMKGRILGSTPERGDVVIVEPNGVRQDYIKRVIGLPGETIAMENGTVIINGQPVKREVQPALEMPVDENMPCDDREFPGAQTRDAAGNMVCRLPIVRETLPNGVTFDTIDVADRPEVDNFAPITIPEGHVFVMGDNRDNSADSRLPSAAQQADGLGIGGPVPLENIGGRAEFIAFSMNGSGSYFNPISWFTTMRDGRFGITLRPQRVTAASPAAPKVQ